MSLEDFKSWYHGIPRITKWWFTGSVIVPVAAGIGLVRPYTLMLEFEKVFRGLQIWRPVTAVLYYQTGWLRFFHYLLNLFNLYSYSIRLERDFFYGREADYVFMLLFSWVHLVLVGFFFDGLMLMSSFILSMMYVYCQLNKEVDMTAFNGKVHFKANRLPWVILIINIVFGEGFLELLGIVVGHLYYYLMFVYPQSHKGDTVLNTPSFLYRVFPGRGGVAGFGQAPYTRSGVPSWASRNVAGFGQAPASRRLGSDKEQ